MRSSEAVVMSPPRHQFVSTASQGSMDEDGEVELAMGDIYRDRLTKTERRRRRRQKLMSARKPPYRGT